MYCPPPVNRDLLSSSLYTQNLMQLFNFNQLQLIHSRYFGLKGVQEESLKKHPFLNAIFKALPLSNNKKPDIEPYVMKMALSKYATNFKNMWDNMDPFYNMLNNLLMVLLRVHLAPKREENKRKRMEDLKKKGETKAEKIKRTYFHFYALIKLRGTVNDV